MIKTVKSDVLIIGGGIAATMAAVAAAGKKVNTVLVDKGTFFTSGSSCADLGGLAAFMGPGDNPELLFEDLLRTGYELNEQNLIWKAAQSIVELGQFLERIGMRFVKQPDGRYWSPRGLGHSADRDLYIDRKLLNLHAVEIVGKEAWRRGIKFFDNIRITKILGDNDGVAGAIGVSRDGKFWLFESKAIILAAGGANNLYPNACSAIQDPKYWTVGDAFTLAYEKGIPLIDMEFANFREGRAVGIRRVGGYLVNARGENFLKNYPPDLVIKASRGKLVEVIFKEIYEGRGPVYWQIPEKIPETTIQRLGNPDYWTKTAGKKVEIIIDFQSLLGGAKINEKAETSIKGLYAAGESAGGFHGADRMQSMRWTECSVEGLWAGMNAAEYALKNDVELNINQVNDEITRLRELGERRTGAEPSKVIEAVRNTMWKQCSIMKEAEEMKKCLETIIMLKEKNINGENLFAALDATNLALVAEMVTRASLKREETRGFHTRRDFPDRDDVNWLKHVAIMNSDGKMSVTTIPVTRIKR